MTERVNLTTDELLDLLDARDAGPDTLVHHVQELIEAHIAGAAVEATMTGDHDVQWALMEPPC